MTDLTEFQRLIGKAIEEAAKDLPEGFTIKIEIEKHGYGVHLVDGHYREYDLDGGNGLISDIEQGLAKAKELASRH